MNDRRPWWSASALAGGFACVLLAAVITVLLRQGESMLAALTTVAGGAVLLATVGIARMLARVARVPSAILQAGNEAIRGVSEWFSGILKPRVDVSSAILAGFQRFESHGKLVVGALRVDVLSQRIESSALGTVLGQAIAREVGIQYFVPLANMDASWFTWEFTLNQSTGQRSIAIHCALPTPEVDGEFIAIDDARIETLCIGSGLQGLNPFSGKHELVAKAKAALRDRAVEIARRPESLLAAERMARDHIERLVQSIASSLLETKGAGLPTLFVTVRFSAGIAPALTASAAPVLPTAPTQ
ncbi:MAG: hypothetical protein EBR10_00255 [Planctomycetes bacterium]|nr:hypothetical protein [Planctomycetota bacterium]